MAPASWTSRSRAARHIAISMSHSKSMPSFWTPARRESFSTTISKAHLLSLRLSKDSKRGVARIESNEIRGKRRRYPGFRRRSIRATLSEPVRGHGACRAVFHPSRTYCLFLQSRLLQDALEVAEGVGPVVALETAQVGDRRLAFVADEVGDGARHLDIDELLLAQDHLRDHRLVVDLGER